jgi:hypothetical protein
LVKTSLIIPPAEWSRKVSDTTYGDLIYLTSFPNGFVTDITLHNLLPHHTYLLTLNGNPKLVGNDLFPGTVAGLNIEKYYDFLSVTTGSLGEYHARIGIYLKQGEYHVRFYEKDTDDFKIVLFQNYFKYNVQ